MKQLEGVQRAKRSGWLRSAALALCAPSLLACSAWHGTTSSDPEPPEQGGATGAAAVVHTIGAAGTAGEGGDAAAAVAGAGSREASAAGQSGDLGAETPAAHSEVWKGETEGFSTVGCVLSADDPPPPPSLGETMVLVTEYDADGALVRASVLFSGPPMPDVDTPADMAFTANCGAAAFDGFVYPAAELFQEGTRMRFAFAPLGAYADWCRGQTPLAVDGAPVDVGGYACRAPDAPDTVAKALCFGGSFGRCACDEHACELDAPLITVDLERDGEHMRGILQHASEGFAFGPVRVALQRIE